MDSKLMDSILTDSKFRDSKGFLWNSMDFYGILWNSMEFYGILWNSMDFGSLTFIMVNNIKQIRQIFEIVLQDPPPPPSQRRSKDLSITRDQKYRNGENQSCLNKSTSQI